MAFPQEHISERPGEKIADASVQVAKEIHEGFKEVAQESNSDRAGRMSPFLNSWKQIVAILEQQVFRQFWTAGRE